MKRYAEAEYIFVLLFQYSIFGSVKDIFRIFQTFIAQTKNSKCTQYGKVSVSEGKTRWNAAAGCYYHSWSWDPGRGTLKGVTR